MSFLILPLLKFSQFVTRSRFITTWWGDCARHPWRIFEERRCVELKIGVQLTIQKVGDWKKNRATARPPEILQIDTKNDEFTGPMYSEGSRRHLKRDLRRGRQKLKLWVCSNVVIKLGDSGKFGEKHVKLCDCDWLCTCRLWYWLKT